MKWFKKESNSSRQLALIAIGFIFLITINVLGIFYFSGKKPATAAQTLDEYPFLDPMRGFLNQEDLIVNIQPLREYFSTLEQKDPNVSIYFEVLNTGANLVVNKNAEFFPASLSKLPLAMSVVKKIERGEWHWDDELVIMPTDKDSRFGDLYQQPVGTKVTIEEIVRKMLVDSDNTAYLMALRNLEPDEFNKTQEALGLRQYFSQNGKISAKRYAVILRALYYATYLTPDDSQKMLNFMTESKFNEYLAAGVPDNVTFAHKIGVSVEEAVHLDAGVVYSPRRPYMLIMMVHSPDKEYASRYMKDISQRIYNYVSTYSSLDYGD